MSRPLLLVVDDDPLILRSLEIMLGRHDIAMIGAADLAEAWSIYLNGRFDAVLLDMNLSPGRRDGSQGLDLIRRMIAHDPAAVVLAMTGHSGVALAVAAMRAGAHDFVMKPWSNARLAGLVLDAVAERARRVAERDGRDEPAAMLTPVLIGECPAISTARYLVARLARACVDGLISGPCGTGKSLFARAIHHGSGEPDSALRVINLRGAEREHVRRELDEAGRIAASTLVFEHLDAASAQAADVIEAAIDARSPGVRWLATARDPARFDRLCDPRAELVRRFGVIHIRLTPLEERGNDLLLLARHFVQAGALRNGLPPRRLTPDAEAFLAARRWKEGVAELRRLIERTMLFSEVVDGEALATAAAAEAGEGPSSTLADAEGSAVRQALAKHGFSVTRAALELGITRGALYRRMKKHGV
jgi:DNA-binding NtrC family response regulator